MVLPTLSVLNVARPRLEVNGGTQHLDAFGLRDAAVHIDHGEPVAISPLLPPDGLLAHAPALRGAVLAPHGQPQGEAHHSHHRRHAPDDGRRDRAQDGRCSAHLQLSQLGPSLLEHGP